jgi:DNA-binding CsgD family transcriptional regulator
MNAEQLAYLLELLHTNTFTEDKFKPIFDELRRITNSGNAFLLENPRTQSANFSLSGDSRNLKLMSEYAKELTYNPFYHFLKQLPHQQTVKLNSTVYKQVKSHPIGKYYKCIDSRYTSLTFIDTKQLMVAFAVNRGCHQGYYNVEEERLLRYLIPRIKIATENRQQLIFLQNRMDNIPQALESFNETVGIIDRKRRRLYCSTQFYNCMLKQNLIVAGIGYLQLTMRKQIDDEPLFILKLKTASEIPQWWRLVYSFTPKEQLLIEKLLIGLSLPEIANRHQVSHNTVRTQLRHILSKTNCRSQNQLLVMLLSPSSTLK